jgi:hypothetical protein
MQTFLDSLDLAKEKLIAQSPDLIPSAH